MALAPASSEPQDAQDSNIAVMTKPPGGPKKRVAIAAETADAADVTIPHYPKDKALINLFGAIFCLKSKGSSEGCR